METILFDYFPRVHTAIAEWLACVLYMLPLPRRFHGVRLGGAYSAFLVLLLATNLLGERAEGLTWILLMGLGMLLMLLMILSLCRTTLAEACYLWAHAFIGAEFAASLEWLLCYLLMANGTLHSLPQTYPIMVAIYALVFPVLHLLNRRTRRARSRLHVRAQEAVSAMAIALAAFLLSNFSFAFRDNVFTQLLGAGVLYSRTLVDFGGLVMLYAHDEARMEMYLRLELEAMASLLNRQYEQYRQFELNNKAMHRIYHDLKHQIAFLRSEPNAEKRESYLSEMSQTISRHEANIRTGSSVLDTLLTSKNQLCLNDGITMTCYADASRLSFMDVMDVCSIFGNAIDNAIECEQSLSDPDKRLIKVAVYTQSRFLVIRIENYCEHPVVFHRGVPVTTKKDSQLHGYGVRSIQRAVEKYHGHVSLEQSDTWFTITALIPLPDAPEPAAAE